MWFAPCGSRGLPWLLSLWTAWFGQKSNACPHVGVVWAAAITQQWGFLLLEGGRAFVALWSVVARLRGRAPAPSHG